MDIADIAALIDPAAEWRYRRQLCREAYNHGYRDGQADACVALAEMQAEWDAEAWYQEGLRRRRAVIAAERLRWRA